ncbi:ATP-binding protein [Nonomuraea pusilla]|uniref:Predicted ATPase n=1 Tax=Nonomuraea pusilla TaxID=46177 RepID=A0A1H7XIV9_9ACTN|nr:LuxR C-terminal-related transcriptional regulator [Nonomuraea pusilla]SEM33554.1 Predicted ATPase [Nonomuraea pusilla]
MTEVTRASRRRPTGRLPAEVTSFVGRRHEVSEVKRLLSSSRAVTLAGMGGVGKTRLAQRVGQEVCRAFRDGVWLVELAALENPGMLPRVVLEGLEVRDRTASPPMQVLVDHLRGKQALVILDNCEHLVEACATLVGTLLRAAPELRVLATSRQALGIAGESTMPVSTLPLPEPGGPRPSVESLMQWDAVRLFTERAQAVLPTFTVTPGNQDQVTEICRLLDGLPLGIELAAVRLRALSVQQLLDRLDDRFRLLTSGSRATLPRHQTLRALIDWSYGLCSEKERLLWDRVSVFAGDLDLDAAEAVCSGDGLAREEIMDLVIGLVEKSVLIREEHRPGVRYRLLDTVRQYGRERLAESGQEGALRRRHRDYYRDLAARARRELFGPAQVDWFTRLHLEHANLRTALEHSVTEQDEARTGLAMASDLLYHWITSYYLGEGRNWLERLLAAHTEKDDVRGRGLWAAAWLAVLEADTDSAARLLDESRRIGDLLGDESVRAYVALYSGMIEMWRGETRAAVGLYEEALAGHRACGDPAGTALALIRLSLACSFLGDSPRAIALGEECLALCDAHGEGWHRAYTTMALGVEVWRQGDADRAADLEKQSLAFNRSLDDPLGAGVNLEVLAWIAATQGHFQRAARLLGAVDTLWRTTGASLSGYGHLAEYHDACERATGDALGEQAYAAAFTRGARLPYDDALGYALQEDTKEEGAQDRKPGRADQQPLTRREMEIAQLVAQGMTNKEIAATLVIAQRTAEGHVEHILTKLGFNSRAQVAGWIGARNRAAEEPPGDAPA